MTTDGRGAPVRLPVRSMVAAAAGVLSCVIGLVVDPRRTAAAYLVGYVAVLAVVLGTLAMIMIARMTAATWFVAVRRQAEQVAATLPILAVLFIPVLIAAHWLYPWVDPGPDQTLRAALRAKSAYLNLPFFIIRALVYWAIWIGLSLLLRRTSLRQDDGDSPAIEHRLRVTSAVGLVLFGVSITFAAFDWMMSLSPTWYSTVYGVDYFAGAMVGGLALLALLIDRGRRRGELPEAIGTDHVHALAKLLITFVLFWVYIGFSQYIVIWSAEIPIETSWYVARARGGWAVLAWIVIIGHFAIPFCALLVLAIKRRVGLVATLGAWLLFMHYLDCYWIVMPDAIARASQSFFGYVLDLGALLFVAGVATLTWSWRRAGEPSVPRGDPELAVSLEYSSTY